MKLRSDFVSNSSSCSFVIGRTDGGIVEGLRLFSRLFDHDEIDFRIEEDLSITLTTARKWRADLLNFLDRADEIKESAEGDWYWGNTAPGPEDETHVDVNFYELTEIGKNEEMLRKVDSVKFRCEDSSLIGTFYLGLMYRFFERNMCCPDPSCTENDFLENCFNDFARKLATE